MRDPARIDPIIEELSRYWKRNPDLRLGQIIGNCANVDRSDPYFMEDHQLLFALKRQPEMP